MRKIAWLEVLFWGAACGAGACVGSDPSIGAPTPTDGGAEDGSAQADAPPGRRAARLSFDVATAQRLDDGATLALPEWLAMRSPSERTTQTGPSTLKLGIGADKARLRDIGRGPGLSVEPTRTNDCFPSTPPALSTTGKMGVWLLTSGGAPTASDQTSPADVPNAAASITLADGEYSLHAADTPNRTKAGTQTVSIWARRLDPAGASSLVIRLRTEPAGPDDVFPIPEFATDTWRRGASTSAALGAEPGVKRYLVFDTREAFLGGATQGAVAFAAYGCQYEDGRYPTSLIVTTAAPVARQAEALVAKNAPAWLVDGKLDVELAVAPHYRSGEQGEHDILYLDDNHGLTINGDSTVTLRAGGAELRTPESLVWERDSVLTFAVRISRTEMRLEVRGAGPTSQVSGTPPATEIPVPAEIFILSRPGGATEAADLRALNVY